MLKTLVWGQNALYNLRNNERGVVSFEYIIVAACIVAAVAFVFGDTGPLRTALTDGLDAIGSKLKAAVGT